MTRVNAQRIGVVSHPAYTISGGIHCVGKNQEIRFILISFIYGSQVGIHLRTNTGAGCKEKFCDVYFTLNITVGYPFTLLIQKRKGLHLAQPGQTNLTIAGDDFGKQKVKCKDEGKKEQGIKPDFLRHRYEITPLIREEKV